MPKPRAEGKANGIYCVICQNFGVLAILSENECPCFKKLQRKKGSFSIAWNAVLPWFMHQGSGGCANVENEVRPFICFAVRQRPVHERT
jgi:hypothetical protein